MKKLLALLLILALVFAFAACGSKSGEETPAPAEPAEEEVEAKHMRVAVCYAGMLGDNSFNDAVKAGTERVIAELGEDNVEVYYSESNSNADWEPNMIAAVDAGYDLIIVVSSQQKELVADIAAKYPDQKFGGIDINLPDIPNLYGTIFAANEGSYMAGVAAGLFTTHTEIEGVNDKNIVGFVGGKDNPIINDFLLGFKEGVAYADTITGATTEVLVSFAGSFTDPVLGKELTLAMYDQGADIVYNVASGTGTGILEAAHETGHYAIGVDINQDNVYPGTILTSMVKDVSNAAYEFCMDVYNDKFEGGRSMYVDVASGGIALTDFSVMREALGDLFPEDIVETCNDVKAKIISGEIVVSEYPGVR